MFVFKCRLTYNKNYNSRIYFNLFYIQRVIVFTVLSTDAAPKKVLKLLYSSPSINNLLPSLYLHKLMLLYKLFLISVRLISQQY